MGITENADETVYMIDQTATLHIPYLTMLREEKGKLDVALPSDYGTVDSDVSVETSLGTIRVVEIERKPLDNETDSDEVMLKFEYISIDSNKRLCSFSFNIAGGNTSAYSVSNGETGIMEHLGMTVERNVDKISINISDLYYYMFGEYVIPLDIK